MYLNTVISPDKSIQEADEHVLSHALLESAVRRQRTDEDYTKRQPGGERHRSVRTGRYRCGSFLSLHMGPWPRIREKFSQEGR